MTEENKIKENVLTVNEIRNKFLVFMQSKGHAIIPSSPLVPENDPTTLFTGSGMQPMLPYLLGQPHPLGKRIADSQKCFRSQDIEEVGDNRHTTFFEMLGNWSFGDYFKTEQITWMFEFFVKEYNLDLNNFYISCFAGNSSLGVPRDNFSAELWQKLFSEQGLAVGISDSPETDGIRINDGITEHIFYYSEKKNWWSRSGVPANMPIGEPGGPDTEMFYDFDPTIKDINGIDINIKNIHANSKWKDEKCHPNCDCGRFMEIGNNVFMQYKKTDQGFEDLPQMNVDHGSGLERWVAAIRDDADMFNIDVFDGAKNILKNISGVSYVSDVAVTYTDLKNPTFAYRVILDHVRAATFLIGDGVLPGNKDQMYFVRRLIRRAVRYARNLNIHDNFMSQVSATFIDYYKDEYKNLEEKRNTITTEIDKEESKFRITLENGIKEFEKIADKEESKFRITLENGIKEFEKIAERKFWNKDGVEGGKISLMTGEEAFNLLQSFGFPIELTLEIAKEKNINVDTHTFDQLKLAHAEQSRTASVGKFKGGLSGDGEMEIKYHTATHMLHQALRQVLGVSVEQKGSNITTERLRFDFSFDRKLTEIEKQQVENIINSNIVKALPVIREETTVVDAIARGAIGLFGDKYKAVEDTRNEKHNEGKNKVSIYRIGEGERRGNDNLFSMELCGGPHVENTNVLGIFKIQKEEAVSAGVRRIKAILS